MSERRVRAAALLLGLALVIPRNAPAQAQSVPACPPVDAPGHGNPRTEKSVAFIKTVPVAEAAGSVRDLYEKQQARFGYVPNFAKIFSLHPQVFAGWEQLAASVRAGMDARRYELITVAAASALRSSYCTLVHGAILQDRFLSPGQVTAVVSGSGAADLSPGEKAIVAFAGQVARDASSVTAADIEELRSHGFTEAEIFDIAATAAARCFFSKLLDALGAEADADSRGLNDEVRRQLTVGRPISVHAPERLPEGQAGGPAPRKD